MSNGKYMEEFREEAIKQIKERGYKVSEVSRRIVEKLGIDFPELENHFFVLQVSDRQEHIC